MRKVNMLSAKKVEKAKPLEKPYKLMYGEGLYLYVTPAGKAFRRPSFLPVRQASCFVSPLQVPAQRCISRNMNAA